MCASAAGFYIMSTIHLVSRTRPAIYKPVEVTAFIGFFVWCARPPARPLAQRRRNARQASAQVMCSGCAPCRPCQGLPSRRARHQRAPSRPQQAAVGASSAPDPDVHPTLTLFIGRAAQVCGAGGDAADLVGARRLLRREPRRLQRHPPAGAPRARLVRLPAARRACVACLRAALSHMMLLQRSRPSRPANCVLCVSRDRLSLLRDPESA